MDKQNHFEQAANNIAKQLREDDHHLSPHVAHRLKNIRENAMQQFAKTNAQAGGVNTLVMNVAQYRYPLILLLCAISLVLSFVWTQSRPTNLTSDAYLLSEDLPPEAFVDEEFDSWITKDSY